MEKVRWKKWLCCAVGLRAMGNSHASNSTRRLSAPGKFETPINILALGGSVTWGSGLENRDDTYPSLLAADPKYRVTNHAIRATGADFPSLCIETLAGASRFDVIMMEFTLNGIAGMDFLLERVHARFPEALIIYVDLYSLMHETMDKVSKRTPFKLTKDPTIDWVWSTHRSNHDSVKEMIQDSVTSVGGLLYEFPRTVLPMEMVDYFGDDWHHLSPKGHVEVADAIMDLMSKEWTRPMRPTLGTWGKGDNCYNWFATGEVALPYGGGTINKLNDYKYTIEFSGAGTVAFKNYKNQPIPLFLSFMSHESYYPITDISVNGRMVVIDPSTYATGHYHLMKTDRVGYADPTANILQIRAHPGSNQPFRLAAIIMCGSCEARDTELNA